MWACSNCGHVLPQTANPNSSNKPCPNCRMAPPIITWIKL